MTVMYGRDSSRLTSIVINISGDFAGEFSDTIVAEGAVSCSVEDANKGTPNEQEMFQAGSLAGTSILSELKRSTCVSVAQP